MLFLSGCNFDCPYCHNPDLIKEGKSSKEIARIMNISLNTVHTYRNKIRKKTNTKNSKVNLRSYLRSLG